MSAANRPPVFPLTVFTGFLGAGKTTLLNRLLRAPELADCMVLINEFGEIGLDHLLVESVANDMVVMTSGCLCCTIRGDLVATLEEMLRRRDNGRLAFNRVVIETTGLADPAPVLHTIMYHPYLMLRFRLDGVVTLVDALNGGASLDDHPEALKQAAVADRLVLTKTDLLAPDDRDVAALRARLSRLNPTALQLDAAHGEARAAKLFDITIVGGEKIGFGEHKPVGHGRLFQRLRMIVEACAAVQRIDERHHPIDQEAQHEIGVIHDRVQHRCGIGKAGRFDYHAVESQAAIIAAAQHLLERRHEIAADRAAEAARGHHDHIVGDALDEQMVEADLAEFVDEHHTIGEFRRPQQPIEQSRLAGAEGIR